MIESVKDLSYIPTLSSKIEVFYNNDNRLNIYNRITKTSFSFGNDESKVIALIDGKSTIEKLINNNNNPFSDEKTIRFIEYLNSIGIIGQNCKRKTNILKYKIGLSYPDRFLTKHLKQFIIIDNLIYILLFPSIIALIVIIMINRNSITEVNPLFLSVSFLVSSFIFLFLHELSHAITAKSVGANIAEIGIMMYWFLPFAYTSICGMANVKSKIQRIRAYSSGIIVNIEMMSLFSILLFFNNEYIKSAVIGILISNATIIISNLLIFLKLDTYYIMEEILDEKNFRENSISYCSNFIKNPSRCIKKGFGIDNTLYLVYGILSFLYICFLITSIFADVFIILKRIIDTG